MTIGWEIVAMANSRTFSMNDARGRPRRHLGGEPQVRIAQRGHRQQQQLLAIDGTGDCQQQFHHQND
jgi:hypothetical protein